LPIFGLKEGDIDARVRKMHQVFIQMRELKVTRREREAKTGQLAL